MRCREGVAARPLTEGPAQHFFGYFDKCPWHPGGPEGRDDRLLAHETELYDRLPTPREALRVGYVHARGDRRFHPVAESRAWNLQQGAMLQWAPGPENSIVFNDREGEDLCAVALDLGTQRRRRLERPVAALSHDGGAALSINFARLNALAPDYGYPGARDPWAGDPCPAGDGIWEMDLASGAARLLVSLEQIAACGEDGRPAGGTHYVNHPLFSPDDRRFCFVHRIRSPAGSLYTRLLCAERRTGSLRVLIGGLASHYDWRNADELLAWAGERRILRAAVRGAARRLPVAKVLRTVFRALGRPNFLKRRLLHDRFILFDARDGRMTDVGREVLSADGHCTFSPDGRWLMTDTYPDWRRRATLILYHWGSGRAVRVAEFPARRELDNEVRCDLHPRWSRDGREVCVDSAHTGARQMYALDVSAVVGGAGAPQSR